MRKGLAILLGLCGSLVLTGTGLMAVAENGSSETVGTETIEAKPLLYYDFYAGSMENLGKEDAAPVRIGAVNSAVSGKASKLTSSNADSYVRLPDDTFSMGKAAEQFTLAFDFNLNYFPNDGNGALLFTFLGEGKSNTTFSPNSVSEDPVFSYGIMNLNSDWAHVSHFEGLISTKNDTQYQVGSIGWHDGSVPVSLNTDYTCAIVLSEEELTVSVLDAQGSFVVKRSGIPAQCISEFKTLCLGYGEDIGGWNKNGFNGAIDDVFFFDEAMSDAQLSFLSNGYSYRPVSDLSATPLIQYSFTDGSLKNSGSAYGADAVIGSSNTVTDIEAVAGMQEHDENSYLRLPDNLFSLGNAENAFTLAFDFNMGYIDSNGSLLFTFLGKDDADVCVAYPQSAQPVEKPIFSYGVMNPRDDWGENAAHCQGMITTKAADDGYINQPIGWKTGTSYMETNKTYTCVISFGNEGLIIYIFDKEGEAVYIDDTGIDAAAFADFQSIYLGYGADNTVWEAAATKHGFNGSIDNVYFFDETLSVYQLRALFDANESINLQSFYTGGASIRWQKSDDGQTEDAIRFSFVIQKDIYDTLANAQDTKFGSLIIPEDMLVGNLSVQTAKAKNIDTSSLWREVELDGVVYMRAYVYLWGIPEESYARKLCARGYIFSDGKYYYSDTVSLSMSDVACMVYDDVTCPQEIKNGVEEYLPFYEVSFNIGDGTGEMKAQQLRYGETFGLPDCTAVPPAGKQFGGYLVNGSIKMPGDQISVKSDLTIEIVWEESDET